MSKKIIVGVLRREVSAEEREAFTAAFPGCEIEFERLDSRDYHEHADLCRKTQFAAVLLPLERPIPSQAMEEGTVHVALIPGKGLQELLPLKPEFASYYAGIPAGTRRLLQLTEGKSRLHVPEVALRIENLKDMKRWRNYLIQVCTHPDKYPAIDLSEVDRTSSNVTMMIESELEGVVLE